MDAARFDALTRILSDPVSRRRTLAAVALGALRIAQPEHAAAGPGCKNVGNKCRRDGQCCSGVCKGKKGKETCRAHDTGGCGKNNGACAGADCTTSAGRNGSCFTTTGDAGYCGDDAFCLSCNEDRDCRPSCGARAACIRCDECSNTGGRACAGVAECMPPA